MTGQEIIAKITDELEPYEFGELEYDKNNEHGLGVLVVVADESFTNGDAWRVIFFKDHDVYIRQNGYYNSYESYAEYDEHDYDVVEPYQKTITAYKKVGEKVEE